MLQQPAFTSDSLLNRLRAMLDQAERAATAMRTEPANAVQVLELLETGQRLIAEMRPGRADMRAEEGRYDSLRRQVLQAAPVIVPLLERASHQPAGPLWQEMLAVAQHKQQQKRRRWIMSGIGLVALLVVVFVVVPWLFPPTPIVNTLAITQGLEAGDDAAIATARAEQQRAPADPMGPLWVGVLEERQGNAEAADVAFAAARERSFSESEFLFDRAQLYVQTGDLARGEQDARILAGAAETAPQGYLLLGQVAELRDDFPAAIAAYERAAQLGDAAERAEVVVTARTRLAAVLQRQP